MTWLIILTPIVSFFLFGVILVTDKDTNREAIKSILLQLVFALALFTVGVVIYFVYYS